MSNVKPFIWHEHIKDGPVKDYLIALGKAEAGTRKPERDDLCRMCYDRLAVHADGTCSYCRAIQRGEDEDAERNAPPMTANFGGSTI